MIFHSHKGAVTLTLNTLWDGCVAGIIDLLIITFLFCKLWFAARHARARCRARTHARTHTNTQTYTHTHTDTLTQTHTCIYTDLHCVHNMPFKLQLLNDVPESINEAGIVPIAMPSSKEPEPALSKDQKPHTSNVHIGKHNVWRLVIRRIKSTKKPSTVSRRMNQTRSEGDFQSFISSQTFWYDVGLLQNDVCYFKKPVWDLLWFLVVSLLSVLSLSKHTLVNQMPPSLLTPRQSNKLWQ